MTFASDMYNMANTLLTTFGQSLTFTTYTMGSYSPSAGTLSVSSSSTYSAKGYPYPYKLYLVDGELIKHNDVQLIMTSTTVPKQKDTVVLDGSTYTVISVEKITAQGSNVAYNLQLRK